MILVPKKILRYFAILLIMAIRWPTPVPFTSIDRIAYQISGKTTMSKEKERSMKDFWVGRMLLITSSISKQTFLLFSKQTLTLLNILQTWKHFQKIKHLCIHSYERESLPRFPKRWPPLKILSKPHKAPFQTIGKAKQVI